MGIARIWIDHSEPIYRRGLSGCLLERGFELVGWSERLVPEPRLDDVEVLLLELGSLDAALALGPPRRLQLVAIADEPGGDALGGVVGGALTGVLIRRTLTPESLTRTLASVADGGGCVPADLLRRIAEELRERRERAPSELPDRQIAVLRLLANGASTEDIATELSYSVRTVKNIVHDILATLGCRTRAHAVALASRNGVI